jgi:Armadillo/beta-catenin-like repeat
VAEQCAWALGNIAGEDMELRSILFAQGALLPLSRLMLSNKGSAARTAAWALSNLIKVISYVTFGEKKEREKKYKGKKMGEK